jgi:hypothetical protein
MNTRNVHLGVKTRVNNNYGGLRPPSFTPLGAEAIESTRLNRIMLHAAKAIAV